MSPHSHFPIQSQYSDCAGPLWFLWLQMYLSNNYQGNLGKKCLLFTSARGYMRVHGMLGARQWGCGYTKKACRPGIPLFCGLEFHGFIIYWWIYFIYLFLERAHKLWRGTEGEREAKLSFQIWLMSTKWRVSFPLSDTQTLSLDSSSVIIYTIQKLVGKLSFIRQPF